MIRIIEGALSSPAHEMIKEEIREHIGHGKRVFLIVPEQQAIVAEAEMSACLPDYAPLYFEVTNFTRLANTVFRGLGGADGEYCDKVQRALLMWRTLTELSPTLTITGGKREVSAGTVERALAAVGEMQSLGIGVEELESLDGEIGEGRLNSKISDLAKIMALFKHLLSEKYSDTADDVATMTKKLKKNPDFFDGALFYIDGFTSFTEPQYELIGLLSRLEDVTVHLTVPKAAPDAFEYTEPRGARDRIVKICDKLGADKKLIRVDGRCGSHFLAECCDLLWRTSGKIDNISLQNKDELKIYECETPYDECDFIAADIRGRVAKGANYRDFAIVARRAESYVGMLDGALEKNSVPHFISKKADMSSFEAVKLIYSVFSIIVGGYRREDVISYAKCIPCEITRDESDEFELYTEKWQIGGRRFTDGVVWNMNPDGYTVRRSENADERLLAIDKTRHALIDPIMHLEDAVERADTVREYAHALVDFLSEIRLDKCIAARTEELLSLGEARLAEENSALWHAICNSLDTLVDVLGDAKVTTDGFLSQLKVVFANANIGRIPAYYDAVTIGSADMLRLYGKKHIYLIGVNRSEFPLSANESSYFTDRDKATLSALGLSIEPDTEVRSARELYCFSRAFSYAEESVSILYTSKGATLKETKRSEVIDRIIEITNGEIRPYKTIEIAPWKLFYSPETTLGSLGKLNTGSYQAVKDVLVEHGVGDRVEIAEQSPRNSVLCLSEASRSLIYKGALALTQSRIDSYNSCPLSYFCKYNLSLSEEERAEFDALNIGSFIHAILEGFFKRVAEDGIKIADLTEGVIEKMVKDAAGSYLTLLNNGASGFSMREQILLDRLTRASLPVVTGLCEEFRESSFIPRFFELRIGRRDDNLPEPAEFKSADGERVFVYGTIDRVDTYKHGDELYVRVVDYKTGKKAFSPADIEKGENLQMFLYLKSIVDTKNKGFLREIGTVDGKKPIPAGVIYLKTEVGDVQISHPDKEESRAAVAKAQTRQGMMLNEPEVINAMTTRFAPVRFTKSGAPEKRSQDKLYTREGWSTLCEKMNEVVGSIATKMKSGDISTSAADADACKYCRFKPICRSAR